MFGIIMPMGRTMMYLPDSNTHSGPWTEYDTKVCIAITIVLITVSLLSILIEATINSRGGSFKESIIDMIKDPFDVSTTTAMLTIFSLILLATWIIIGLVSVVLSFME